MFTVRDVLSSTKGRLLSGKEYKDDILTGLSTDTRRLKGGELFAAIKGERFDGHNFVLDAVSRGAGGILVQGSNPPALEYMSQFIEIRGANEIEVAVSTYVGWNNFIQSNLPVVRCWP